MKTPRERSAPACCKTCAYYVPAMKRKLSYLIGRECAAFGTVEGVKGGRCGAWSKREITDN